MTDNPATEPTAGPALAETIVLRHTLGTNDFALLVDGKPFPWYVSEAGAAATVAPGHSPGITVTIPTHSLAILHEMPEE